MTPGGRARPRAASSVPRRGTRPGPSRRVREAMLDAIRVAASIVERDLATVEALADLIASTTARGRTVFLCGNGGSAAEAQHLATELVVRFTRDRRALPALALTADTATLTAAANDYGFERVFARQLEALGRPGDLLLALTTSGRSPNVLAAVRAARAQGLRVAGMTGLGGRAFARRCDVALIVPSRDTARIQEAHLLVGHLCCDRAESLAPAARRRRRAR